MRSSLLEEKTEDYLLTARAKGLRDALVRRKHAVPNALLPTVTLVAAQLRLRRLRRDHGRDGLLVARARAAELPGAERPRHPAAAGRVPAVLRGGDRVQPRRGHHVRLPRSEGDRLMATTAPPAPAGPAVPHGRVGALDRLGAATGVRRPGLADLPQELDGDGWGSAILIFFTLIALFIPVFSSRDALDVTKATAPNLAPPSWHYPLGTDESGRSVLTLTLWGSRISLLVGFLATLLSMVIGAGVGIARGLLRRLLDRRDPGPAHRLVPGHPVPAAGDRARNGSRAGR